MITIIAAVAADRGIGYKGDLLWHIPADLKHFKQLTLGAPVIMGRHTWESLPKRPLPGRRNIVVSGNPVYQAEGAEVFGSLEEALQIGTAGIDGNGEDKDMFIIGGASLYAAALPMADALELTEIEAVADNCDTYFPEVDFSDWKEVSRERHEDDSAPVNYSFCRYERLRQK